MFHFFARLFGGGSQPSNSSRPVRNKPRLRPEVGELCQRILPSANAGALGHFGGAGLRGAVAPPALSPTASALAREQGEHGCHQEGNFAATLTNATGATGKALFNNVNGKLSIQVSGAAASSSLDVQINGTSVGTLTTDVNGNGRLSLTQATTAVAAGTTLTVGDLTGAFAQTQFKAPLTGTAGATGNASFNVQKNGLKVAITGAAANTTYDVTVDSTVVGQITTNARGMGKLQINPTVPIAAGTTVSVADTVGNAPILQGAFA